MGTIRRGILLAILLVLAGVALGFSRVFLLEAVGTLFFIVGGAILALAILLGVSSLFRGLLFDRSPERGRRFN